MNHMLDAEKVLSRLVAAHKDGEIRKADLCIFLSLAFSQTMKEAMGIERMITMETLEEYRTFVDEILDAQIMLMKTLVAADIKIDPWYWSNLGVEYIFEVLPSFKKEVMSYVDESEEDAP